MIASACASPVNVVQSEITDNAADSGAGLYVMHLAQANITHTLLASNAAQYYGGAIMANAQTRVRLTSCRLESNTAGQQSGAMHLADQAVAKVVSCRCISNRAKQGGFLAMTESARADIASTDLVGNNASALGGAVYAQNSSVLTMTGCNISGDGRASDVNGGAIYLDHMASANLTSCHISDLVGLNGAGLVVYGSSRLQVTNCTARNLTASQWGGGLAVAGAGKVLWVGGSIVNCHAESGGVANVWGNASATFANTIMENDTAGYGGAVSVEGPAMAEFIGCSITRCAASEAAGALFVQDQAHAHLTKCTVSKCSAVNAGAVGAIGNGSVYLEHCRVLHNTAKVRGGAVSVDEYAQLHAVKTVIFGNSAATGGGIAAGSYSYVTLSQCLLYGNNAMQGGGMGVGGNASLRMAQSAVLGNRASIAGGGVYFEGGNYVLSQVVASVHDNKAPLVPDTVIFPNKLTAIGAGSLIDNFVSRLGADDGILNVTLLASGPEGVACPGMDVAAALVESDAKLYVLATQKTANDGKVHMRIKLRRPPDMWLWHTIQCCAAEVYICCSKVAAAARPQQCHRSQLTHCLN